MEYESLDVADVVRLTPQVFGDERGFFLETFRQNEFEKYCGPYHFVQDNHSRSTRGTLRGLHYQFKRPQGKLVRVTRGEVFDVAVDLRRNSLTFGKWVGVHLSETNKQMLWVPPGFAHGFYTISEVAEFQYKCTDYYAPGDECCIRWDDPDLSIQWPMRNANEVIVSEKDSKGNFFSCTEFLF
ncbi:dTDP-4-dehydrorhamnose 3,5-epimerase [Halomonas elongata]|uniref:dTDP-4-dehydrorhamnose 3,5-epimerase n=1 Tax=Halomonas elongata TaxID=2746 RepID=UPI0033476685